MHDHKAQDKIPKVKLGNLLREGADYYKIIEDVVDIYKTDMPVISDISADLLQSYILLYGKQDNRHGGFDTASNYEKFMQAARSFPELPEIKTLAQRIEKARTNLERTIRNLAIGQIEDLGYELNDRNDKLLVYEKDPKF